MTKHLTIIFTACCSLVAGDLMGQGAGSTRAMPESLVKSKVEMRTYNFKAANKEMEYARFVPSTYDPKKNSPLIVALHGLGGYPGQIMGYPGLTRLAERHGYVVVAPMGYNSRGWYGSRGKGGGRRNDPKNLGELSELDVMNVLQLTLKQLNIDKDRIYLMGHSMGGGGTWHLGLKHPDLWAALAPISPAIYRPPNELEKIKHIPVIVVHGAKDRLVRVEGVRKWVDKMKQLEMTHKYIEDEDGGHIFVAFENLPNIFEFFNKHRRNAAAQKSDKLLPPLEVAPKRR